MLQRKAISGIVILKIHRSEAGDIIGLLSQCLGDTGENQRIVGDTVIVRLLYQNDALSS